MTWYYGPYAIPLFFTAIGMVTLACYALRRRGACENRTLALIMGAVAIWSLAYALELGNAELPAKLFWARLKYAGIVVVPTAWLLLTLQYTGRSHWLKPSTLVLLGIGPLATLLLVWTNRFHHLFWTSASIEISRTISVLFLPVGVGFWLCAGYFYLLVFFGTALIFEAFLRSHRLYRRQAAAMLLAAIAPWVGNGIFLAGWSPFPHLDPTPFAFAITCIVGAYALFRLRLADLVPIAHAGVIRDMDDSVIMLDVRNRIVELNPACRRLSNLSGSEMIGSLIEQTLPNLSGHLDLPLNGVAREFILDRGISRSIYDVRVSPLQDRQNRPIGKVVVLRDITKRKEIERELQTHRERLEEMVRERTAELETSRMEVRLLSKRLVEAQEDERRRTAKDFLDGLAQRVDSLKTDARALLESTGSEDVSAQSVVGGINRKLDGMIADIRRFSSLLLPSMLDDLGLISAIESYLESFRELTNIEYRWSCEVDRGEYRKEVSACLYRLIQEGLSNIGRHANASLVKVRLFLRDECLVLVVEDNGRGFDLLNVAPSRCLGLTGMRKRVEQIGGTLRILSTIGGGTTIEAKIPL
ncbi:PAS domain S-box protein [Candidatus Poribacteria bacterium]|nr:PAS domain S-box protein [Candidatus Poribacteria bacterium]